MTPILLASVLTLSAGAQQPASQSALDHLTAIAQDYFRGLTENLFDVNEEITFYNLRGKPVRTEDVAHGWGVYRGRFVGLGEGAEWDYDEDEWSLYMFQDTPIRVSQHPEDRDRQAVRITDANILKPWFAFSPQMRGNFDFELSGGGEANTVAISFRSHEPCAEFWPPSQRGSNGFTDFPWFPVADQNCGSGQIVLDQNGAVPVRATFNALGLPSGKKLKSFHEEIDYKRVRLPGEKQPFLFPATATGTFGFDNGTIVVECEYSWMSQHHGPF